MCRLFVFLFRRIPPVPPSPGPVLGFLHGALMSTGASLAYSSVSRSLMIPGAISLTGTSFIGCPPWQQSLLRVLEFASPKPVLRTSIGEALASTRQFTPASGTQLCAVKSSGVH